MPAWCLLIVLCLAAVLHAQPPSLAGQGEPGVTFEVDLRRRHQTIRNFGSSSGMRSGYLAKHWPRESVDQLAEWLFSKGFTEDGSPRGAGLSCFRVQIGAGTAYQGEGGRDSGITEVWRRTECFLQPDGTYDWDACAGEVYWMRKARELGVETVIGYSNSPPIYFTKSGYGYRTPGTPIGNLKDDRYDDFARFLATVASHFERRRIGFDYISPINEPQWAWQYPPGGPAKQEGSEWTNAQIKRVVLELNRALNAKGARAKVLIPETADLHHVAGRDPKKHGRQLNFFDPGSDLYLGRIRRVLPAVAAHSYFTDKSDRQIVEVRRNLRRSLDAVNPKLEYWQSEYSMLQDGYREGRPSVTEMDGALFLAKIIHYDLTEANAAAWQFWASNNSGGRPGQVTRYSLNAANGPHRIRATKNLWALGHFSRFIRPGMQRVGLNRSDKLDAVGSGGKQMASAYLDRRSHAMVVVVVNYEDRDVPIRITGFRQAGAVLKRRGLTPFVTTADASINMKRHAIATVDQTLALPARSIVTFVTDLDVGGVEASADQKQAPAD